MSSLKIIAHGGDSKHFPQNRSAAFKSARMKGAHVLETDLHRTSDDKVVLNHDDTVDDGFGPTAVRGMTSKDFMKLEGALTLNVFLQRYPELFCNMDLKDKDPWLIELVVRTLRKRKARDRVIISSFHHTNLKYFRRLYPDCETSMSPREIFRFYLACKFNWRRNKVYPVKYMQVPETYGPLTLVTPRMIEYARSRGVKVQPWTINKREDMVRLINWGVDGIITDDPGLLAEILKEMGFNHEVEQS
ncbi:MAG: glycerophosphodiester phosphodiesterase family protein [Spirochaetales bacterium]|nr:glycerophosphodiester phosphodiesterase family protein [Spirochaetales bacterium]